MDTEPETYLQWAKDGQALYFNLAADNAKNIWRQSLSETEPQQITYFDKEQIFRFASSPYGKKTCLYLLHSNFRRSVVEF